MKIFTRLARPKYQAKLVADDGSVHLIRRKAELCLLARHLGFRREDVLNPFAPRCEHKFARHGQDCPDCGLPAAVFIKAARDWLDQLDGATVEDPGYFPPEPIDYSKIPGQEWRTKLSASELRLVEVYDSTCYVGEQKLEDIRRLKKIIEKVARNMARFVDSEADELPPCCCLSSKQFLELVMEELKKYVGL